MLGFLTLGILKASDRGMFISDEKETYEYGGRTWEVSQDELPLKLEDLTGESYEEYIRENDKKESLLLRQESISQRPSLDAENFRELPELEYSLITVKLPALRERREDIPLLARHFADRQAVTNGLPRTEFSADALQFLSRLPYPGNIRELKNLVERTILVSGKPLLDASDFDAQYIRHDDARVTEGAALAGMTLDEIERQTILQALDRYKGNLSQVATALGISRAALYRRLEKYNITM